MPKHPKGPLILAVLIITVGLGWLLTVQRVGPGIHWVWTMGLGVVGILTFVVSGGIDKASLVVGPFFLIGSLLSILRQTGNLSTDVELPVLVVVVGVLLLIVQLPSIPPPRWLTRLPEEKDKERYP